MPKKKILTIEQRVDALEREVAAMAYAVQENMKFILKFFKAIKGALKTPVAKHPTKMWVIKDNIKVPHPRKKK